MKSVMALLALIALAGVAFACRGGSDKQSGASKPEIAAALTSFVEGFVNGDTAALPGLWSKDCTIEEVSQLQSASQLFHQALGGGQLQLTVNTDSFVIEIKDGQVTVPIDQPEGALAGTFTLTNGQAGPYERPLAPFKLPIVFARENGAWKVHNCGGLFPRGDQTPATAIP